ncbi:MAG: DegT/DnrJ/EryC1/StrS family aminotransferase, partial [Candidatus Daviesbacteria bacterium]|nr:DegT/DnrJ/EryC1/StrS family aminotransferase [Candidatus Daviesbacteria bacterium]
KKYKLKILEDACESLGAIYKGKAVGTTGDIGTFAFYPNKQMTTGEGGMIVTNSKEIYELCDSLRNQGRGKSRDWLVHERLGFNYRMDEMSASLGITQLKKINFLTNQKKKIASWYNEALKNIPGLSIPTTGPDRTHSYFVYVIRVGSGKRNILMNGLNKIGIQTKPYLPVIHLQPFMRKLFGFKKGDLPVAEKISGETLALPFYIGLTPEDIDYISGKVKRILNG